MPVQKMWNVIKKTVMFLASLVLLFCLAVSVDDYEYGRGAV
jgi:hypothetical protein